nr:MAG TPA: hypothetical protein [Caudoviricetes sp.]
MVRKGSSFRTKKLKPLDFTIFERFLKFVCRSAFHLSSYAVLDNYRSSFESFNHGFAV